MIQNKFIFWFLSFTWGIIMTVIGSIAALICLITRHKPKKWGHAWYFEVGEHWGGVELGPFFIVNKNSSKHIRSHEFGHGLQNCKYGPFMVVISLMSVFRYWYREFKYHRKGLTPPTTYDDVWYEGEATKLGTDFINTFGE